MSTFNSIATASKRPLQVKKLVLQKGKGQRSRPVPWSKTPYVDHAKIGDMHRLEELVIRGYEFDSFDFNCEFLTQLRLVDLSYNDFGYWLYKPRDEAGIRKYGCNHVPYIAPGFYDLKNIEEFSFSGNRLGYIEFPEGVFPKLKVLDLSCNERDNLLDDYDIETCVLNLPYFPKLERLNLHYNLMLDFPKLHHLTALTELDLTVNCIPTIPTNINSLTELRFLAMNSNALETFPQGLILPKLHTLTLANNKIWWFDEELQGLSNLKALNLAGNQIESLPQHFFQLKNLEKLDLSFNQLEELPYGLRKLKRLKWLSLEGNSIKQASIDVFRRKHPHVEIIMKHNRYW